MFTIIILIILCIVCWLYLRKAPTWLGGATRLKDLKKHPRTKSEQTVIDIVEKITGEKFPTAYPPWLKWKGRPMELDGYNGKLKIGIEFSGPLHTKFYPSKESYHQYAERIEKDRKKIELCKKHKVHLIVVDMAIAPHLLYRYMASRLYDIGVVKEKPFDYMVEFVAEPYTLPKDIL